jgi:flavin-binding protein dodecin
MAGKVFKMIRLVGVSTESYEKAIESAIREAQKTLHGLSWFEVLEWRGAILDDRIEWQATVEIGFKVDRPE